ncbi:MAG: ISNCY family transposase [Candidatus Bathyarchaeota archaeon]|nr:ISNCY family transposase [Candidatus Bathyarchaeota archaeon]
MVKEYRRKYKAIAAILDANHGILAAAHRDLARNLSESREGRRTKYTSEEILRALIVMFIEGDSYRDVVVRIENSEFLRDFVGLGTRSMMDFTFLSRAFGCLSLRTWKDINERLKSYAVANEKVSGEKLRADTTVYEANIHYPADSSLLWDSYRVLVRLLRRVRKEYPGLNLTYRFHDRKVKKLYLFIGRTAGSRSKGKQRKVKSTYGDLIKAVERVVGLSDTVVALLPMIDPYALELDHFRPLARRVIYQARCRVLEGKQLSADEKLYSIFEEHTELLKRGKARRPIEFGHKVLIGQTAEKFITQYHVMRRRREDKDLVDEVIASHVKTFGTKPDVLSADKGFYESMKKLAELSEDIETVSICKKGRRNEDERERESSEAFMDGQRFRAGIEGTISVLKRAFKLFRCLFKGFKNYAASVGCAVFCHNLVLLTRL